MSKRRIKRRMPYLYAEQKKELNLLQKRGVEISIAQYKQYERLVKKANVKGEKIKGREDVLHTPKFTKTIKQIKSTADFEKYYKAVTRVNKRGYTKEFNRELRENFILNLKENMKLSEDTLKRLREMSDADFKKFVEENADLNSLIYGNYEDGDSELIYLLDLNEEKIKGRLNN